MDRALKEALIEVSDLDRDEAISIDKFCNKLDLYERPEPSTTLVSQKMGVHEWSYDNDISQAKRYLVPHADHSRCLF